MDIQALKNNPEFENFIEVHLAFLTTGKSVAPFVDNGIRNVYQHIHQTLKGLPLCQTECSRTGNVNNWCSTCSKWKEELCKWFRPQDRVNQDRVHHVDWRKTESWKWQLGHEHIKHVFLPSSWTHTADVNFEDMSTVLHPLENCREFEKIPLQLLQSIRRRRNLHFGHNSTSKISDAKKTSIFNVLNILLKNNAIQAVTDTQPAQNVLHDLEGGYFRRDKFDEIKKAIDDTQSLMEVNQNLLLSMLDKNCQELGHLSLALNWTLVAIALLILVAIALLIGIIGCAYLYKHYVKHPVDIINRDGPYRINGCISDDFSYPWRNDLRLDGYVLEHDHLIGRKWLLDDLREVLPSSMSASPGILLISEMGYGKSAIVSHLICAAENSPGDYFKSKIIAFHICKFDAYNTQNAARFIRRLVGLIARKIPEYMNIIETHFSIAENLRQEVCNGDPKGCIDQVLVHPLRLIKSTPSSSKIILIDALDECYPAPSARNSIFDLIKRTSSKFPKWIKFLITARNVSEISRFLTAFTTIHLDPNDPRNIQDVKEYAQRAIARSNTLQDIVLSYFGNTQTDDFMSLLEDNICGNFLVLVHSIQYWSSLSKHETKRLKFPSSLDIVFELNFERIYGEKGERFETARLLFQIICASLEPLHEDDIYRTMKSVNTKITKADFERILDSTRHFVRSENGKLRFNHKAIAEWLTNKHRRLSPFYIEKEEGHKVMSKYLFTLCGRQHTNCDMIGLAIHVKDAKDMSKEEQYKSVLHSSFKTGEQIAKNLTYQLAFRINRYDVAELVLNIVTKFVNDFDKTDQGNITASFVAAQKGHAETLRALLDYGGNLSFRMPYFPKVINFPNVTLICKHLFHCGYGLLDISAQFGNLNVVRILMQRRSTLAKERNGLHTYPIHLACESGHLEVVEEILKVYTFMSDSRCLYLAAMNGDHEMIQLLLSYKAVDGFSRCQPLFEWIPQNATRTQSNFQPYYEVHSVQTVEGIVDLESQIVLYDDTWLISCETALHAAARNGNAKIVEILLRQTNNAKNSVDRFGRTPYLTSVWFNQTETALVLSGVTNVSQTCLPDQNFISNELLHPVEIEEFSKQVCDTGLSGTHIIAMLDLIEMSRALQQHRHGSLEWDRRDPDGSQPIHYAACHNSIRILSSLNKEFNMDIYTRSFNGSTPFHSAAICGAYNALGLLYEKSMYPYPFLRDDAKRSLFHYTVMKGLNEPWASDSEKIAIDSYRIIKLLMEKHGHDIELTDDLERNILHYATSNGHYIAIAHIKHIISDNSLYNMLEQKDVNGQTPIAFAVDGLPRHEYIVGSLYRVPQNCSLSNVFTSKCNFSGVELDLMSAKEVSIWLLLEYTRNSNHRRLQTEILPLVHEVIKKSSMYLTAIWFSLPGADEIKNKDGMTPLGTFLSEPPDPSIGQLWIDKRYNIIQCGKPLSKSPLHLLALNQGDEFHAYQPYISGSLGQVVIHRYSREFLDSCFDQGGYNILHRAAQGGNVKTVIYLLRNIKMSLKVRTKNGRSIAFCASIASHACLNCSKTNISKIFVEEAIPKEHHSAKTGKYKIFHIHPKLHSTFHTYDRMLTFILHEMKRKGVLKFHTVCNEESRTLSIVHLAAYNLMDRTLRFINNTFGIRALNCMNYDKVRPLYMVYLRIKVGQQGIANETKSVFKSKNVAFLTPSSDVEIYILWSQLLAPDNVKKTLSIISCMAAVRPNILSVHELMKDYKCLKRITQLSCHLGIKTPYRGRSDLKLAYSLITPLFGLEFNLKKMDALNLDYAFYITFDAIKPVVLEYSLALIYLAVTNKWKILPDSHTLGKILNTNFNLSHFYTTVYGSYFKYIKATVHLPENLQKAIYNQQAWLKLSGASLPYLDTSMQNGCDKNCHSNLKVQLLYLSSLQRNIKYLFMRAMKTERCSILLYKFILGRTEVIHKVPYYLFTKYVVGNRSKHANAHPCLNAIGVGDSTTFKFKYIDILQEIQSRDESYRLGDSFNELKKYAVQLYSNMFKTEMTPFISKLMEGDKFQQYSKRLKKGKTGV